jgi:peptidoglycan/LPS O-acetylase OafA/YrhL
VEYFFTLSGFLFFWLYSEKIHRKEISFREFSILRISRLYPLHIASLVLVIALQWLYLSQHQTFFVYQDNDLYHFWLNLTFTNSWGFQSGASFNGPSWSISVEILLYLCFFALARLNLTPLWLSLIITLTAYCLARLGIGHKPVNVGLSSFFAGGSTFLLTKALLNSSLSSHKAFLSVFIVITGMGWALDFAIYACDFYTTDIAKQSWTLRNCVAASRFLILFPLTVACLATLECKHSNKFKSFGKIGNITYASYLLHFPLQLIFVLCAPYIVTNQDWYNNPATLILFFGILIPISALTYQYFERPAQRWIRRTF